MLSLMLICDSTKNVPVILSIYWSCHAMIMELLGYFIVMVLGNWAPHWETFFLTQHTHISHLCCLFPPLVNHQCRCCRISSSALVLPIYAMWPRYLDDTRHRYCSTLGKLPITIWRRSTLSLTMVLWSWPFSTTSLVHLKRHSFQKVWRVWIVSFR